jgi:hypothetical protein
LSQVAQEYRSSGSGVFFTTGVLTTVAGTAGATRGGAVALPPVTHAAIATDNVMLERRRVPTLPIGVRSS